MRGAGDLDLAAALHVLPPEANAAHRTDHRLGDHQIHQLAVDELLHRQRPKRPQRLAVEAERVGAQNELEEVEAEPVAEHRQRIEEDDAVEGGGVDQRRQEGQGDLEQHQVGQAAAADLAGLAPPERGAVLPDRLKRPVGPSIALAPEAGERRRGLGPATRILDVDHPPSGAADRDRQVRVLRQRRAREAAGDVDRPAPERPDSARDRRHAAQCVVEAPVEVESDHVVDVLPAPQQAAAVAHLRVARHRAHGRGRRTAPPTGAGV